LYLCLYVCAILILGSNIDITKDVKHLSPRGSFNVNDLLSYSCYFGY